MKLFSLPDGTVDRKDRAQWLTSPFDLAFETPVQIGTGWARGAVVYVPGGGRATIVRS